MVPTRKRQDGEASDVQIEIIVYQVYVQQQFTVLLSVVYARY